MRTTLLVLMVCSMAPSVSYAQQCLHGPAETPEQAARRREALNAARLVNTLQANQPGVVTGRYLRHDELPNAAQALPPTISLAPGQDVVPGWRLTLDTTPKGYWFAITDTTDPCGFRYISNEVGTIFRAEPLR